jgi:hypothetical protein
MPINVGGYEITKEMGDYIGGLSDTFDGSSLDTDIWSTFGTQHGSVTVSNGECIINNSSGGESDKIGIYSNIQFPVGMSISARVKNTSGRHSSLIGFGESVWEPYPHAGTSIGCTWYSRADNTSSTIGSYYDENGNTPPDFPQATQNLTNYQILSLYRVSESQVDFYRNGIFELSRTGVKFQNKYSVYFSADGYSNVYSGGMDNIIVIDWVIARYN